jgi:hypothetical protein
MAGTQSVEDAGTRVAVWMRVGLALEQDQDEHDDEGATWLNGMVHGAYNWPSTCLHSAIFICFLVSGRVGDIPPRQAHPSPTPIWTCHLWTSLASLTSTLVTAPCWQQHEQWFEPTVPMKPT